MRIVVLMTLAVLVSGSGMVGAEEPGSAAAPMPLSLINFAAPDAGKQVQLYKGFPPGSVVTVDKGGIAVEFAPFQKGCPDHPAIMVAPADGKFWDLSAYGHIEAKITNTGDVAGYNLFMHIFVDGDKSVKEHDSEILNLAPGETKTVKIIFGYEKGYKPAPAMIKTDKITGIYFGLYNGDHKTTFRSFRIEELKAAGTAGEKPVADQKVDAGGGGRANYTPSEQQLEQQWLKWKALWEIPAPQGKTASAVPAQHEITPSAVKQLPVDSVDLGNGVKLELVQIPAGEFLMGSPDSDKGAEGDVNKPPQPDEKPQHRARITKPFYMGKYPVTQEQWEVVMGSNPSLVKGPKNPVEQVSWEDCQKFLDKLNAKLCPGGGKFQLPTEAQWEYACRAGSTTKYYFGDDEKELGEYSWYLKNSGGKEHPVGEKKPNAWGLYDMHGNVWEWCQDWYGGRYYKDSPADDPAGLATGSMDHVYRGGSWYDPAEYCRSAFRYYFVPYYRYSYMGFRVSRAPADDVAH